jgi:U2 small nuclear ribonucleoprotein B''
VAVELNPPNKVLFIQHVPKTITAEALTAIFSKFPGFKDVKLPKSELAFAFYETDHQASLALKEYQGWKFSPNDHGLVVNFAKK